MSSRMTLLDSDDLQRLPEGWQRDAAERLQEKMTDKAAKFPCIPAVQGHMMKHFRYGFLNAGPGEAELAARGLAELLQQYGSGSRAFGPYTSLVVLIHTGRASDGRQGVDDYERLFWMLLSRAAEYDPMPWPEHLPDDPSHHLWEYCHGGEPYFVYCGTPAHEQRRSRFFPYMMLAFTPRWVLREFNARGRQAERTKGLIRERLEAYDPVPPHPDLKLYGAEDNFEWKQYFLRDGADSPAGCPFAGGRKKIRS